FNTFSDKYDIFLTKHFHRMLPFRRSAISVPLRSAQKKRISLRKSAFFLPFAYESSFSYLLPDPVPGSAFYFSAAADCFSLTVSNLPVQKHRVLHSWRALHHLR